MTAQEAFRAIYLKLKSAQIENPHLEASWIVEKFVGQDSIERIKNPDQKISDQIFAEIEKACERRAKGEPLAYILEEQEFFGRRFHVNPHVLIPRPETEILAEWAIEWAKNQRRDVPLHVLDLGAGSGCIGLTILKDIPHAQLTAVEKSKEAMAVAKINAKRLDLEDKVEFINMDAAKAGHLMNRFDLVVANPPYIAQGDPNVEVNVKKYEPQSALFSGDNGLADIKLWLAAATKILRPRAAVGFEVGSGQAEKVLELFRDQGIFAKQYVLKDYSGHERVVCGER